MKRLLPILMLLLIPLCSCATFDPSQTEAAPGYAPGPMILDGTTVKPRNDAWSLSAGRSHLEFTADTVLTAAQCLGAFITNQGAAGEVDLTLYALSQAASVTVVVEETQIIEVNPPSGELFDLDGTNLDADDCIDSPAIVGSKMVCTRMKIADGTWRWSCDTVRGTWVDTGATD